MTLRYVELDHKLYNSYLLLFILSKGKSYGFLGPLHLRLGEWERVTSSLQVQLFAFDSWQADGKLGKMVLKDVIQPQTSTSDQP